MSRALGILLGFAADRVLGDPRRFHPVAGFGQAAARLESRWYDDSRVTAAGIALGVGADALFGDPRRFHPVAGFGQAAAAFERVVYRPTRSAGTVYAGVLVGGAALLGVALERALPRSLARGIALYVALGGSRWRTRRRP